MTRFIAVLFIVAGVTFAADDARRDVLPHDGDKGGAPGKRTGADDHQAPAKERDRRKEEAKKLSAEERDAKRKEIKGRLEKRLGELRSKATNGTLSAEEKRELTRREQLLKRFEQAGKSGEEKR
jgi:hypothetical protein